MAPNKPKPGEWFTVAPTFIWRCCECSHAARMQVRVVGSKGKFQVKMRGQPIRLQPLTVAVKQNSD